MSKREYTYQELMKMGGVPAATSKPDSSSQREYTYDELMQMGGKPADVYQPPAAGAPAPIPQALRGRPEAIVPAHLKSLMTGVDPSVFSERVLGALSTVTNTMLPSGDTRKTTPQLPELSPEEEIGAKTATVAGLSQLAVPAARALSKVGGKAAETMVEPVVSKLRRMRAGGDVPYVRQQLGPTGAERQASAIELAPELAKDSTLLRLKGMRFDRKIYDDFKTAEANLGAASKSVPHGTSVTKKPIMDELITKIDELSPFSSNPEITANPRAEKILGDWYNKLDKLPDQVPFDELRDFRQKLDHEIMTHGGWKETATAADRAEMQALRDVSGIVRKQMKGISTALDDADAAYGPAADAVSASGLDWKSGLRLSTSAKPPAPGMLRRAAPYIAGAAGATAASKILGVID